MVGARLFSAAALVFAAGASVVALRAQSEADANAAIIRTEAREVVVEVTVGGIRGTAAGELAAKDFSIWEDGKPQKINSVPLMGATSETTLPEPPKHFAIVFSFGGMSLADQAASKNVATKFIDEFAGPECFIAVVGPNVLQNFTTAKAALKQAVASAGSVAGRSRVPSPQSVSLDPVVRALAPAPGRKVILVFTAGLGDAGKAQIAAWNQANVTVYVIAASQSTVASDNAALSRLDSPAAGMSKDPSPAAAMLNSKLGNPQPQSSPNVTRANADALATATGGLVFGLSDAVPNQLAAIARDQDVYRISYTPPPANEGACHTLRVATDIRGLTTRSRSAYCTEKAVDLVAGKIDGQALESRAAGAGAGTVNATMQLPYVYTGTNRASVYLSIDIVPAGMRFERSKTGFHGQIDLVGTTKRPDGGIAERFADTIDIDKPDQQQADSFTHVPYHYEHQFTLAAGTYTLQMQMGAGPNAVGKAEMPLTIEQWNSAAFGIGGIALSKQIRAVDATSAPDAPALEGIAPLIAGGKQFIPAATDRFQKSDPIYFYTEVYDPALSGANPPAIGPSILGLQFRILDRKSGEVKQDSGVNSIANYVHMGDSVVPFATRLPVSQLPAGLYTLEVRAGIPATQETVTRTIDFELN